jgi:hypothetical protein
MVAGVIMVSASAAFHLAGTRFGSGESGRLGRMPWRQHSSWSLYLEQMHKLADMQKGDGEVVA